MSYEDEFKIFSNNVNIAARAFYYYKEINSQALENFHSKNKRIFTAMEANARFWNHYNHYSIEACIIALGRIFDNKEKSHGISRLLKLANEYEKFKEFKIKLLEDNIEETKKLWADNIKDVRHKLFAHQERLTGDKKIEIRKKVTYDVIEDVINKLLTLENAFSEIYYNSVAPDFSYINTSIKKSSKTEITSLLERLANN